MEMDWTLRRESDVMAGRGCGRTANYNNTAGATLKHDRRKAGCQILMYERAVESSRVRDRRMWTMERHAR